MSNPQLEADLHTIGDAARASVTGSGYDEYRSATEALLRVLGTTIRNIDDIANALRAAAPPTANQSGRAL